MSITTVFDPPLVTDSTTTFSAKSFDTFSKLNTWAGEANAVATTVNADKVAAAASAALTAADVVSTAASAAAAATSSAALPFVVGSYNAGVSARSNVNYRVYTARTTGAKATDPSADPTNWALAYIGSLPDVPYTGTTAAVSLGERSRLTNVAAVAVTVPLPTASDQEWAGLWENGLTTNSFDIGVATLKHNGVTLTGVITNSQRLPIHLVSVGVNTWRFAS